MSKVAAPAPAPVWPTDLRSVPRLWPESTIICIGTGPSLTKEDVDLACNSGHPVIAVNDAWRLTGPRAAVLFASDAKWWSWIDGIPDTDLPWHQWTVDRQARRYRPHVQIVNFNGADGLETHPSSIRTGGHSGYMAINMAVHFGAKRIVLLGYDLQPSGDRHHFFGEHPDGNHLRYDARQAVYQTLQGPLQRLGIELLNASRITALTCIPRCSLADALAG